MSKEMIVNENNIANMVVHCPFCGEKPFISKNYLPTIIEIACANNECNAMPNIQEEVALEEKVGDSVTYRPMFELHWESALNKWNKQTPPLSPDTIKVIKELLKKGGYITTAFAEVYEKAQTEFKTTYGGGE
jgi:hypothetical protein